MISASIAHCIVSLLIAITCCCNDRSCTDSASRHWSGNISCCPPQPPHCSGQETPDFCHSLYSLYSLYPHCPSWWGNRTSRCLHTPPLPGGCKTRSPKKISHQAQTWPEPVLVLHLTLETLQRLSQSYSEGQNKNETHQHHCQSSQ